MHTYIDSPTSSITLKQRRRLHRIKTGAAWNVLERGKARPPSPRTNRVVCFAVVKHTNTRVPSRTCSPQPKPKTLNPKPYIPNDCHKKMAWFGLLCYELQRDDPSTVHTHACCVKCCCSANTAGTDARDAARDKVFKRRLRCICCARAAKLYPPPAWRRSAITSASITLVLRRVGSPIIPIPRACSNTPPRIMTNRRGAPKVRFLREP